MTTSLPVDRDHDVDDDEDYHDEMTSFGSGYYDNNDDDDDDDDAVTDYYDVKSHQPVDDVRPSSSSSFHSLHDNNQRHVKDISRTLSTTPADRTLLKQLVISATRRTRVDRRWPVVMATSSSSSAAARRRHYSNNIAPSCADLVKPFYTFSLIVHCVVVAILFSSEHVFLLLPVTLVSIC